MKKILITSCKGGVGKSTVGVCLSVALAKLKRNVLLIDFDLGNRSLDLMLGLEDSMIYDICDLALGRADCDGVIHLHPLYPNLAFVGAPFRYEGGLTPELLGSAVSRLCELYSFDFVIIDTSGGAHESVSLSAPLCDTALIVTSQNPTSIRAAEKSGVILDEAGLTEQYLIINGYDMQNGQTGRAGVIDMIDRTRTSLIGIVPMDPMITLLSEHGKSIFEGKNSNSRTAFSNIANRLCGRNIPLLSGFRGIKRDKFLYG